jgi:hypothetical protein
LSHRLYRRYFDGDAMSEKTENPPAFPVAVPMDFQWAHGGMTLRDYFAGQALAGMLSRDALEREGYEASWFADWAYGVADAMLAARAKSEPTP